MAGSINKVILIGNLGADPEIRRAQATGNKIANFRIATSEQWKDKNTGERKEATEWHSVVVFNEHIVEVVEKYLKKGMKVFVEGQQKTRKWTDRDGVERYTTETVLQAFRGELQILEKANRPQANGPDDYGTQRSRDDGGDDHQRQIEQRTRDQQQRRELDDEIPF